MLKKFLIIIGILMSPLLLLIVLFIGSEMFGIGLSLMGYYVNKPGWEIAQVAAEKHDVNICRKMWQTWFVIGPQAGEQIALCFYDYARLTQDPTACELLLPSKYGWSCLGAVKSELGKGWGCGSTAENINCGGHDIYAKNLGISNCNIYKEQVLKNWCYEERSAVLPGINDCDKISSEQRDWQEECQGRYAFKQKDASLCSPISNEKRRKVCELEIQYSQLSNNP